MNSQNFVARWVLAIVLGQAVCLSAMAQTTVNSPIVVPLEKMIIGTGDSSYVKLGIWATLGAGGTPGLFEFDTGGAGFYAVQNSNTSWWGTGGTDTGNPFTQLYASGFQYTGNVVQTQVNLFSSGSAQAPLITTPSVLVGQTTQIVDVHTSQVLWNASTALTAPPIDTVFFGDFGLSLQNDPGAGIVNAIAQLTYGAGIKAGFIVHAGAHGNLHDASFQVGITEEQMAEFPIQFAMRRQGHETFPNSAAPFYELQVITGEINLTDGDLLYSDSLGVTFDTGNQTPVLFDASVPADLKSGSQLKSGVQLSLIADGETAPFYQLLTGNIEGVNKVDSVSPADPSNSSINLGLPIFEQYTIAFNLADGIIGLRPIPEPSTALLLWGAAAGFLFLRFRQGV